MVLPNVALRLLAASCLLTGVALAGSAMAASPEPNKAESASITKVAIVEKEAPACARKVKVVYAGYGEAARASCAVTAKAED